MPITSTESPHVKSNGGSKQVYLLAFILVTSLFFLWGIANSLNGTLIKHFQTALNLNRAQAGIVDSAFYIGYFVMALPAGFLMNRIGYKKGILIGLFLYVLGAVLFYPAAEVRVYGFFLAALFIIACGLAFLETAANPYVTVLGDQKSADSRINFSQSFNGLGVILGPVVGSLFIFSSTEHTNESLAAMPVDQAELIRIAEAQSVQTPYLVIAGVVLFVAILFAIIKMPEIGSAEEAGASFSGILRHKHLVFGVVAQFFYVGAQASVWGYFVDYKLHFAKEQHLEIVNWIYPISDGMTATQIASFHASFAFILFMVGRFFGTWLLTKFASHRLLATYAAISIFLCVIAMLSSGLTAVISIMVIYFFMSIMFPTIFSLSIRHLGAQVKIGSGLVIMAIVGGAVLPPITGWISLRGIEYSLIVPIIAFVVILLFGLVGYKVSNSES
jgi:FHS family L-fucose permease-like MFS transporter